MSATAVEDGRLESPNEKAILSHFVRRAQRRGQAVKILTTTIDQALATTRLPSPSERLDNLVLYLATLVPEPGIERSIDPKELRAFIGTVTEEACAWIIGQAEARGWLVTRGQEMSGIYGSASLTIEGWERHEELLRSPRNSRHAFMAMQFGAPELENAFSQCFTRAARRAGFDLRKLDDDPRAGLIDDRLRTELRLARFVIADLSHGNSGAYWEAGFAEGLGRPVIYTCETAVFNDHSHPNRPHFDANHYLHVVWDGANLRKAEQDLVNVIRATLPAEAVLQD